MILDPAGHCEGSAPCPVHEIITRQARQQYLQACAATDRAEACRHEFLPQRVIQDSLVRGVWWNDDPNQTLYKAWAPRWLAYMHDAHRRASNSTKIDDSYMMQYRSHYGDMQFLHSMASANQETASDTRQRILMWGEFAYRVSLGEFSQKTRFQDVPVAGLDHYFGGRHANWEIRWILQPRYLLRDSPRDFEEHALGSLLHMVQDSYSAAHVERRLSPSEACPAGSIVGFNSYTDQNPSRHGQADVWKSFASVHYGSGVLGPVEASARLIEFSRRKADWKEVKDFLQDQVYCFDATPRDADDGGWK